jgi:hypothetical protein
VAHWLALGVLLFWVGLIFEKRPARKLVAGIIAGIEANPELLPKITAQVRALVVTALKEGKKPRTATIEW